MFLVVVVVIVVVDFFVEIIEGVGYGVFGLMVGEVFVYDDFIFDFFVVYV